MANEITIRQKLAVTKGNLKFSFDTGEYKKDMVGSGGPTPGFITVTTTERVISFSEIGDNGEVLLVNLDPTNYIRWGYSTGVYGSRIEPGRVAGPLQLEPSASLYIIADTADCDMFVYGFEK